MLDLDPQPKRIYALVPLSYVAGVFQVIEQKVQKVPYQSVCIFAPYPKELHVKCPLDV